jgi:hypothetical protein
MNLTPISPYWEDVYHANLLQAFLAPDMELINHTFRLPGHRAMSDRCIQNPVRGFRTEFSHVMADWILDGQVQVSEAMLALNPNAAKFATTLDDEKYGYHVTAYGPRIKSQLEFVVAELQRNPDSRRACIMMLAASDQFVAEAMAAGDTKCEYLCTYAFNFRLRKGSLDLNVSMRSNNYTTTVCQDVYVFARLQEQVAQQLGVPVGEYYHHTASGHVFIGEEFRAAEILSAYCKAYVETYGAAAWNAEWGAAWKAFVARCLELGIEVA